MVLRFMGRKGSVDRSTQKVIASSRVHKLFVMAEKAALSNKIDLATRYVELARRISMKYQMSIPKGYKRCFCKHCYSYLLPDVNSRYRVKNGRLVIFCKNCKKYMRMPFK